jgi:hypothetical protein
MSDPIDALVLDLLEWIGSRPREYREVLEAWRTSCPRLAVWEEASLRGLVVRNHLDGRALVSVTPTGREFLEERRSSLG